MLIKNDKKNIFYNFIMYAGDSLYLISSLRQKIGS